MCSTYHHTVVLYMDSFLFIPIPLLLLLFLPKDMFIDLRERERELKGKGGMGERETERERHHYAYERGTLISCLPYAPQPAHNLGMCPDPGLNLQPLVHRMAL